MDINDLISLIQTQKSHIDTLDRLLQYVMETLELSKICYKHKDYEEMNEINNELIEFLNLVLNEEFN